MSQSIQTSVDRTKANYLCSIDKVFGAKDVVEHCKAFGVDIISDTELIALLRKLDQT